MLRSTNAIHIPVLEWDDELEQTALAWAHSMCLTGQIKQESLACRRTGKFRLVGQNFAHGVVPADDEESAALVAQVW